jgi:hypothetical protein
MEELMTQKPGRYHEKIAATLDTLTLNKLKAIADASGGQSISAIIRLIIAETVSELFENTPQVPKQAIKVQLLKGDSLIDATSRLLEQRHALA